MSEVKTETENKPFVPKTFVQLLDKRGHFTERDYELMANLLAKFGTLPREEQNAAATLRLRELWADYQRNNPNVTQAAFARDNLDGWSQGNFSQYLTGKAVIGNKALEMFCKAFNCQRGDIRHELKDYRLRANEHNDSEFASNASFMDAMANISILEKSQDSNERAVAIDVLKDSLRVLHKTNKAQIERIDELDRMHSNAVESLQEVLGFVGAKAMTMASESIKKIAARYGARMPRRAA